MYNLLSDLDLNNPLTHTLQAKSVNISLKDLISESDHFSNCIMSQIAKTERAQSTEWICEECSRYT